MSSIPTRSSDGDGRDRRAVAGPPPPSAAPWLGRIGTAALVAVALATAAALRDGLERLLGGSFPFFSYYLAALATAVLAGVRAGLVVLALGFVAALVLPAGFASLPRRMAEPGAWLRVAVFCLFGGGTMAGIHALRLARTRAAQLAGRARATALEAEQWRTLCETLVESAPVGMGLYDAEGRVLRVNSALAAMHAVVPGTQAGTRLPDLAPGVRDAFAHVLRTRTRADPVEFQAREAAALDARWFRTSLYPVRGPVEPRFAVAAVVEDVTAPRAALESLRESEERYRSLVAATAAIVSVADAEGRIASRQPSWEAYTGQPWPAYGGYGYLEAIHPDDREGAAGAWAAARAAGVVFEHAARLRHAATDDWRYCTARVVPVLRPDGSIREWVSSIADDHERVLAQEALAASEARFREMANLIPQVVWTANSEGRLDYYNQQWLRYAGLSEEEARHSGWQRVVHPDDLPRVEWVWAEARRTESPVETEFRQRGHDGRYRWFLCRAVPLRDRDGRIRRWLGTSTDIDDKKRVENALRAERDVVETVNRVGRALSAQLDLDRLLESITDAATRLTGAEFGVFVPHGRDEARGILVRLSRTRAVEPDPAHPAGLRAHPVLAPVFEARTVVRAGDVAGQGDGGGVRSLLGVPVVSRSGDPFGALVFGHRQAHAFGDRDERLLAGLAAQVAIAIENASLYDAERRARAEAEAANRAKDEFLSTLSHELRTPLTAMLGWLRLLRDGRLAPTRVAAAIETVERSGWALARMVDDLLDVSRIVTGRTRLDLRPVDLRPVLEAAAATIRPTAESKQVDLVVRAAGAAPVVAGDPGRLQQVAWNLLANAVKFTPPGGRVELSVATDAASAHVVVRDTGVGIPADFLPHVFERFRQRDASTQRQHGGLGLGLAIVRHLVELHGGEVRVASAGEGGGTTFTVTLPLAPEVVPRVAVAGGGSREGP